MCTKDEYPSILISAYSEMFELNIYIKRGIYFKVTYSILLITRKGRYIFKINNVKSATFAFPPSRDYKDAVYERLQKACSDYYDFYCLEAEFLVPNEHVPIESNIEIDWSTTIFHKKGFDWWFDLRTDSLL